MLSAWLGLSFLGTSDTRRTAALALVEEAEGYFRQQTEDSYRQAIKKFDEAKVRWHSIGDDSEEAKILNREGEVYYWLGELPESLV